MSTTVTTPADLVDLVGTTLGTSSWHEINQDRVDLFADATGDHQWIHVDPERAAKGPYGRTIAHGYLTLSLVPLLVAEVVQIDKLEAAVNYGLNKVRFPAPVPVGARLRATVDLAAAQAKPAGVEATFRVTYEVEGGDRPACIAEAVVLYR